MKQASVYLIFFVVPTSLYGADDFEFSFKMDARESYAQIVARRVGPLTLEETITKHEQEANVRATQLKKLSEILARASKKQSALQLAEQDALATLQQLKLMKQQQDAKRLARLQNSLQCMKIKEEMVTAEIEKLTPKTIENGKEDDPLTKTTQTISAPTESTSSWSLWKLLPFTS